MSKALDAAARQKGFPDYATYKAWESKRTQSIRKKAPVEVAPKNWMQKASMAHPAKMFDYISKKIKGVNERE